MPIPISCPSPTCKSKLKAPDRAAGRTLTCPKCGSSITVPVSSDPPGSSAAGSRCVPNQAAPTAPPIDRPAENPFAQLQTGSPQEVPGASPSPVKAKRKGNAWLLIAGAALLIVVPVVVGAFWWGITLAKSDQGRQQAEAKPPASSPKIGERQSQPAAEPRAKPTQEKGAVENKPKQPAAEPRTKPAQEKRAVENKPKPQPPLTSVNSDTFKSLYRVAKEIEGAQEIGLNRADFGKLLQQYATELSIAKDKAESPADKRICDGYSAVLQVYRDAARVWDVKISVPKLKAAADDYCDNIAVPLGKIEDITRLGNFKLAVIEATRNLRHLLCCVMVNFHVTLLKTQKKASGILSVKSVKSVVLILPEIFASGEDFAG